MSMRYFSSIMNFLLLRYHVEGDFFCCTIFISVGVLFSKSAVDNEHAAVVDHVSALNNSAC